MTWALQDAKNKFSAVADKASRGEPQLVTRHGKPLVMVISYDLYCEKVEKRSERNIWQAFRECPVDIDLAELTATQREISGRAHEEDSDALFT